MDNYTVTCCAYVCTAHGGYSNYSNLTFRSLVEGIEGTANYVEWQVLKQLEEIRANVLIDQVNTIIRMELTRFGPNKLYRKVYIFYN